MKHRLVIEKTIGVLNAHFHSLNGSGEDLQCVPDQVSRIVIACCTLHNFAIKEGICFDMAEEEALTLTDSELHGAAHQDDVHSDESSLTVARGITEQFILEVPSVAADCASVEVEAPTGPWLFLSWGSAADCNKAATRSIARKEKLPAWRSAPVKIYDFFWTLPSRYRWRCVPASPQRFPADQELRLWSEIDDLCSSFLPADPQPQPPSTLEELCYMALTILQRPQDSEDKGQTKRFLFHYSKTHDSGNSDFMSSVLHPLLQLVPELHERRMKKGRGDEEFQGPRGIQSRGYYLFRPRNGRRSSSFR
ncbi:neuromedin-U [Heptranchias perlo]|uniref:neuromedin-U n=1 Tax=Heptranchias perlo TaxID=212740 RepID=UPI00355A1D1E